MRQGDHCRVVSMDVSAHAMEYIIAGEHISPYLLFSNSHDGSEAVKVAITPIRVVCNNGLKY